MLSSHFLDPRPFPFSVLISSDLLDFNVLCQFAFIPRLLGPSLGFCSGIPPWMKQPFFFPGSTCFFLHMLLGHQALCQALATLLFSCSLLCQAQASCSGPVQVGSSLSCPTPPLSVNTCLCSFPLKDLGVSSKGKQQFTLTLKSKLVTWCLLVVCAHSFVDDSVVDNNYV